jgi:hypothetical protein
MMQRGSGRSAAGTSVILGVLWFGFALVAARLGLVVKAPGGRAYLDDTAGFGAACVTMTPVVMTLGIGLAGVAFAQVRRVTALIAAAAALHVTVSVWIGVLFGAAARARVR